MRYLLRAKYGTRDSNSVFGYPEGYYYQFYGKAKLGWCVETGMNDTEYRGNRYYKTLTAGQSSYKVEYSFRAAKEMGYENFEWAVKEFVAGIKSMDIIDRKTIRLTIEEGGVSRHIAINQPSVPAYEYGNKIARVLHGKTMDVLPISGADPERNNGFYQNEVRLRNIAGKTFTFGAFSSAMHATAIGLFSLKQEEDGFRETGTTIRLAFDGRIEEVKNVEQYKLIENRY